DPAPRRADRTALPGSVGDDRGRRDHRYLRARVRPAAPRRDHDRPRPGGVTQPVLVTGGTGVVGGAVLRRLVADGRAVRALARSEGSGDMVAALGVEAFRGDALDLGSLTEAMRG